MIKLNKKGQSLIMFIIFLPVLLMSSALIIDTGIMYNAKIKGSSLLKYAIKENIDIEEYFKANEVEVKEITWTKKNSKTCVIINTKVDSIFGSLIGIESYDIKIENC